MVPTDTTYVCLTVQYSIKNFSASVNCTLLCSTFPGGEKKSFRVTSSHVTGVNIFLPIRHLIDIKDANW